MDIFNIYELILAFHMRILQRPWYAVARMPVDLIPLIFAGQTAHCASHMIYYRPINHRGRVHKSLLIIVFSVRLRFIRRIFLFFINRGWGPLAPNKFVLLLIVFLLLLLLFFILLIPSILQV